ncbi:hypothetical protein CLAFUW4_02695 [Fulvia fulva]|nr:uncharacterized protein CLAFUR5_20145 [Fulvia fulva]KAK4631062.1 hypothetical protein CLAFUR4_02690 [Fulvia fulva]KAK4633678.1 hypothetical protein CLAFUR0_02692 [Fulvia fulva]WMI38783.1 hypothetical protein CLAFUR5_20145 [Fulvia fulva]WPV10485.1 hypothetical protein CLAFUW4_02695 [Fulvia fulva]WPV26568.1 hypothetical protein CLAFUW7_02694 [Fulvia fulva]
MSREATTLLGEDHRQANNMFDLAHKSNMDIPVLHGDLQKY